MENGNPNLVVLMAHGTDHELPSVAFTIANVGLTAGLGVPIFLTSASKMHELIKQGAATLRF
jgi:hypothetical protein